MSSGVKGASSCFAGFLEQGFIFHCDRRREGIPFNQNDKLCFFVMEILRINC